MHSGKGRLLQGEERIELGQGDYYLDDETLDIIQGPGRIEIVAPYGTRLRNVYDDGQFILETCTGKRFDLADVHKVRYFDKSQKDIDYHRGWHGTARTEITVHFTRAVKQKNWRPVLLQHGIA